MGAPRMTRADAWRVPVRDCVARYRNFKDEVRRRGVTLENGDGVIFVMPMPKRWSKKTKALMDGEGCTSKPDIDNILKALMDALFVDDAHIWKLSRLEKVSLGLYGRDKDLSMIYGSVCSGIESATVAWHRLGWKPAF